MKYAVMSEQRGTHSVEKRAEVLSVARCGYYAWAQGEESSRSLEEKKLVAEIQQIQSEVDHRYGNPRMTEQLRRRGRKGVSADETFFLGGIDKPRVLEILKPHIYFDDQLDNLKTEAAEIPSVHIPFGVKNMWAFYATVAGVKISPHDMRRSFCF